LERLLVIGMPEPMSLVQRRIGLDGPPAQIPVPVNHVPVLVKNFSVFVPDPTNFTVFEQTSIGEDERVRLIRTQLLYEAREVVNMPGAAGAIEPELDQLPIVLRKLRQLRDVIVVIVSGICITRLVPVP